MDNLLRGVFWAIVAATVLWFVWVGWVVFDTPHIVTLRPTPTQTAEDTHSILDVPSPTWWSRLDEPPRQNEDERLANNGFKKSSRVLPPNPPSAPGGSTSPGAPAPSGGCDALSLPPREYVIDDGWTETQTWEQSLPDMNGDGVKEVGTTSGAYLNPISGDSLAAAYLTIAAHCHRFVGVFFGDIIDNPIEYAPSWKPSAPRAFLVRSLVLSRTLTSKEYELHLERGQLVVVRYRFRMEGVESGPHCMPWQPWGKPFSNEFWELGLGDDLPDFSEPC